MRRTFEDLMYGAMFKLDDTIYEKRKAFTWNAADIESGEARHVDAGTVVELVANCAVNRADWLMML